ncbi:MAG: TonB-dependent receptor plug domain-containing protein [Bacteroidota bacterium]
MQGRCQSDTRVTIQGFIKAAESEEPLSFVSVQIGGEGCLTNEFGFFVLSHPVAASLRLEVSYPGYEKWSRTLDGTKDQSLEILLVKEYDLDEVEIIGKAKLEKRIQISEVRIPVSQIEKIPAVLGEPDVLKAFQLMPGIQSGYEGTAGLFVRGGSPDQNLILLDDVPLYYINHLGGIVSIFDPGAIRDARVIKGGFPARYGGRISSVVDLRMKDGNLKESRKSLQLGVLASRWLMEGPLKGGKTSYLLTARLSTLGPFTWLGSNIVFRGAFSNGYNFTDLFAKIHHRISPKSQLSLSVYAGDDRIFTRNTARPVLNDSLSAKSNSNIHWGNIVVAAEWKYLFGSKSFQRVGLSFTRFRYGINSNYQANSIDTGERLDRLVYRFSSGIQDINLFWKWQYRPNNRHQIRAGAQYSLHRFIPGITAFRETQAGIIGSDTTLGPQITLAHDFRAYVEDEFEVNERLSLQLGLHASMYGVSETWYPSLEPRFATRFLFTESMSMKLAASRMQQPLHLLTNSGVGLPTDLWVSPTANIPPQTSWQYAVGYAYTHPSGFELSLEAYYKQVQGLISYREGASLLVGTGNWEDFVVSGGEAEIYGVEWLLQKPYGRLSGWLGYTLSWNTRQFDELNGGEPFPYIYDRRHDISLVGQYQLKENISLALNWQYSSGRALTIGNGTYDLLSFDYRTPSQQLVFNPAITFGSRNNQRMPDYHRLDLSIRFTKALRKGSRTWDLGLYNAYNRQNAWFYYYQSTRQSPDPTLFQFTLFPILPIVRYSREF